MEGLAAWIWRTTGVHLGPWLQGWKRLQRTPALVLLVAVLLAVACTDSPPRPLFDRTSAAWEVEIPPAMPQCPGPGDEPDPFPPDLADSTSVVAGAVPGSFSVSSTGEAVYSVPLVVPPGRAGMQPTLAITYDSEAGEGPLGLGFSIGGLSAITRCARNVAQDGEIVPVRDDADDALCLDGKRLVPLDVPIDPDPVHPYQSREYRTLPDTFSRIVAGFGEDAGWDASRGPRSLQVFTKSGLILEYGSTADGQVLAQHGVVRSWLLTRVRDRSDNSIEYSYRNIHHPADGYTVEHAPTRISYTGHPQRAASRAVIFKYAPVEAPDMRVLYARGMELRRTLRLDAVQMLGPGDALVREYRLTYGHGPATGRLLLETIAECDGALPSAICKPPTRFTWHTGGSPQFQGLPTSIEKPESELASLMLLDATGDGLDDLVIPDIDIPSGSEQPLVNWTLARNRSAEGTPAFFDGSVVAAQQPIWSMPSPIPPDHGTPLDYNHDGRIDVLLHDIFGQYTTWRVLLATEQGTFTGADTGIARVFPFAATPPGLRSPDAGAHLADVDGDGMTDLIQCAWNGVDQSWSLHRWKSAGPGFDPVAEPIAALHYYPCNAEVQTVDLDADGRVDLVMPEIYVVGGQPMPTTTYDAFTYELGGGSWTVVHTGLDLPQPGGRVLFLDVNGDGLPDAIESGYPDGMLRAFMNTGAGFMAPVDALDPLQIPGAALDAFVRLAAPIDWNADGRQDLLLPIETPGGVPAWRILQATGAIVEGMFALVDPGLPMEAQVVFDEEATVADPRGPRVTDVDGDGIQDVLLLVNGQVQVFKNTLHEEDLLATVTDGMNAHDPGDERFLPNIQISYGHLTDLATATADIPSAPAPETRIYLPLDHASEDECTYPVRCVVGPRRVVSGYILNNGADQPRHLQVAYRNGRHHRLGRGWLGFGARIVRDLDTGAGTAEFFDNTTFDGAVEAFPYAGQLAEAWRWSPSLPPDPTSGLEVGVELLYTDVLYQTVTRPGGTYFTIPVARHERRAQDSFTPGGALTLEAYVREIQASPAEVLGETHHFVGDFDAYGNVLDEITETEGVDLELHVTRQFDNDEDEWLIGRLKTLNECSSTAGLTQCRTSTRTYDSRGRVRTESAGSDDADPETQLSIGYARDDFGNIIATLAEDAFGQQRTSCTSYDEDGVLPYAQRNPAGHLTFTRHDPALGVLKAAVDPNGLATRWAHDGFGRVTRERGPDGVETTHTLTRTKDGGAWQDEWNLKVRTITPGWRDDTVQYDSLGRAVRSWQQGVQVGAQPAPRVVQDLAFDATGEHVARHSVPHPDPAPPPGNLYLYDEYERDAMGRVIEHISPWGAVTTTQYIGRAIVITAPGGVVTRIENDALGRPVKIIDPEGGETSYTYGPFGGLWTVTDPGGAVTTTERDDYGRVRLYSDPDRGKTEAHYDGFGQQRWSRDEAGREIHDTHDPLGRPVLRADTDGVTTWTWDTAAHGIGKLADVESPDGHRVTYTYDALGRLQGTGLEIDGESFATGVTYDTLGRVDVVSYPQAPGLGAFAVRRQYDAHGHLVAVRNAANSAAYWQVTSADGAGRITGELFGNGATTTRSYHEPKQRLQSILTTTGGSAVQDLVYAYDDRLNLSQRTDLHQGKTEHFKYDRLDRLKCAEVAPSLPYCIDVYIYAPNGNILSKPGVGAYGYHPDQPHAATSAGGNTYSYDEVGNQRTRPGATITYTAFDLPKTFTLDQGGVVTLDYDGNQRRIRKTTPEQQTLYVGDLYERVTDLLTGMIEHRYYVHGAERAVAMVRPQAASPERTLYMHVDHLGSVEALTNEAGTVVERRSYDAFGARRNPTWGASPSASFPTTSSLGFTGHEDDAELGLVNMGGRLYDPHLSRFLTPDPIVAKPAFSQSWNPYSYVLNGPLSHVDPTGFTEEPADAVVSPDGFLIIPEPSDEPYVDMVWQVIAVGTESEEPSKAPASGAAVVPQDANTWGNNAGWLPQPSATAQELPRQNSVGLDVYIGVAQGTAELALDAAKALVLNALTFGGYGTWQFGKAIWAGYQEDRYVGALNAVNPLYQLARGGADTYMAAERGDYRAAGAAGVKTVVLGAAAVVGAAQAVGALAEGAAAGVARGGALAESVLGRAATQRIQNAANRTRQRIIVVGSRAEGKANPMSDWDYILSGNSAQRHSAAGSIPRGLGGGENGTGIDVWQDFNPHAPNYNPLDPTRPHIIFEPSP